MKVSELPIIHSFVYRKVAAQWISLSRMLADELQTLSSTMSLQQLIRYQQRGNAFLDRIDAFYGFNQNPTSQYTVDAYTISEAKKILVSIYGRKSNGDFFITRKYGSQILKSLFSILTLSNTLRYPKTIARQHQKYTFWKFLFLLLS